MELIYILKKYQIATVYLKFLNQLFIASIGNVMTVEAFWEKNLYYQRTVCMIHSVTLALRTLFL